MASLATNWAQGVPELLRPLFRAGLPTADRLRALLARYAFPIAEPGTVTFAWLGEAEQVDLVRWIHAGADRVAFTRFPGTDLWYLRLPAENGGRFEYKLGVTRHGHEALMLDPFNPHRAGDPFGENSVCRTWGYAQPEWTMARGAPAGEIVPLPVDSAVFGETRAETAYLPVGYDPEQSYPVVVFHDGQDFNQYASLAVSLDNLIAAGDIPPVVGLLIQTQDRMGEYPGGRRHARYLVDELLPEANRRFSLSDHPSDRVLLGASLGAVASLSAAFRYPGVFGGLVLKSGSFIFDESKLAGRHHPVFHRIERLVRALHRAPELPKTRAFVSTGELEGLADQNRVLANFLRDRKVDVLFRSAWDGHHWHNWRDQLRDGLMWVLDEKRRA